MKKAFTLVELILVIVIVAIMSMFAVNLYLNIYRNYITSRAVEQLESRTQAVVDQISQMLRDRVVEATIARVDKATADFEHISNSDTQHKIIEWIGKSTISQNIPFKGTYGWSGLTYLEDSNDSSIVTPGTNIAVARSIIKDITGDTRVGLIFAGNLDFDGDGYGFDGNAATKVAKADLAKATTLGSSSISKIPITDCTSPNCRISEKYYMTHSAYAIVPTTPKKYGCKDESSKFNCQEFELKLVYNYQPWNGNDINTGQETILAKNVTRFRFRGIGSNIELKICMRMPDGSMIDSADFIVCKTKVVQ